MLASATGDEASGNQNYQNDHMGKIFSEGFSFSGFERDKLYLNRGGSYVDISGLSGLDAVGDGRGAAWADFDNDGDYDLFLTQLQGQAHRLYRNEVGQRHNWLRVELVGQASGADAWGSEVRIETSQGISTKVKAGGSGFVSQSDPRLLFGLGSDTAARWLEVRWSSGQRQRFGPVAGGTVRVVENATALERIELPATQLPDPMDKDETTWAALALEPGAPFPAIALEKPDGTWTDFAIYRRSDRHYLVNIWATYCAPCLREMPELESLSDSFAEDGIEIIGISLDMGATKSRVPNFVRRLGISYPIFNTDERVFKSIYAGEQIFIPLSILIDQQGRVVQVLTGWSENSADEIRTWAQR